MACRPAKWEKGSRNHGGQHYSPVLYFDTFIFAVAVCFSPATQQFYMWIGIIRLFYISKPPLYGYYRRFLHLFGGKVHPIFLPTPVIAVAYNKL